jgi:ferrochelatase
MDIVCPGFVSDCLETLEEIAMEVKEAFLEEGGEVYGYIPCLNDNPLWIQALEDLATSHLSGWPLHPAPAHEAQASREAALAMGAES